MSSTIFTSVRPTLFPHLPSPASCREYQQPRRKVPFLGIKQQHSSLVNEATCHAGGLRSPPAERSMSTAYHPHNPALSSTYNSHVALARQPAGLVQSSRAGTAGLNEAVSQMARSQPQQHAQMPQSSQQHTIQPEYQAHSQQLPYASNLNSVASLSYNDSSRLSTRNSTPASSVTANSARSQFEGTVSRRDSTLVMHSLRMPSCISNGGNLDDFASLVGGHWTWIRTCRLLTEDIRR